MSQAIPGTGDHAWGTSIPIFLESRRVGGSELPVPQVTLHLSPISVSSLVSVFLLLLSLSLSHTPPSLSHVSFSPHPFPLHFSLQNLSPLPWASSAICLSPAVPPSQSLSPVSTPSPPTTPSACSLKAEGLWGSVPVSLSLFLSLSPHPFPPACSRGS